MYSVQEVVGTAEVTQGGVVGGSNPARPHPRWLHAEQLKLLRYNAMWARAPAALGWAAVAPRLRPPPRLRPQVPVGLSPLRRGAL